MGSYFRTGVKLESVADAPVDCEIQSIEMEPAPAVPASVISRDDVSSCGFRATDLPIPAPKDSHKA